jgi:hypothetical protein
MAKPEQHDTLRSGPGNGTSGFASNVMPQSDAIFESYSKFLRQMEDINRQWVGTLRQTADANWELASRIGETIVADAKRASEFYFRLYDVEVSRAGATARNAAAEGASTAGRHLSAVQRSMSAAGE